MKKDLIQVEESSFRDPSGFIYYKNNKVYRQINNYSKSDFDLFVKSGLKKELENRKFILKSSSVLFVCRIFVELITKLLGLFGAVFTCSWSG